MKELEIEFIGKGEVKGFKFFQKRATERSYLYEVSDGEKVHYEVFKKRINTRYGEPNVSYPTSKGFGIWAKTTRDYNKALSYFQNYNTEGGSHE